MKGDEKIIKTSPCPECQAAAFGGASGLDVDNFKQGYAHDNAFNVKGNGD